MTIRENLNRILKEASLLPERGSDFFNNTVSGSWICDFFNTIINILVNRLNKSNLDLPALQVYKALNAPTHPVRNRLITIGVDKHCNCYNSNAQDINDDEISSYGMKF
jgi:hypothetical protein